MVLTKGINYTEYITVMKTFITDQFLWDVYNILEKTGNVAHFIFRRKRTLYDLPGLKNPLIEKYRKLRNKQQFNKLIYNLKRNNYIKIKSLKGKQAIVLTGRGVDKALKARFKIEGLQDRKKRKDGKWIMIIFDVPEKYKKSRELLRSVLQNLGYKMFQKSAWITPYDVSEKTEELLQFYNLEKYVKVFLIEEID
ncbi:MAG: hypothetical protein A3C58_00025 [Candidatus Staskawiczbacteria bacterium RIFCSPHIGHO2_02_FULL_34_10]|uniref:Transcriptional repressor PaaX-like central Cas2-like domain-containing protein n=2 Tax=Candidatus Staskawicziibacteriota TaxID=1817916 RepID=A0A1G2HVY2_9BACT|nr:MAG: hypothetical protein A3C58_00025 [Candidatus Staskawiczbacteria bacterium RIFCSPHIGHO2_02_FULL_34_10]